MIKEDTLRFLKRNGSTDLVETLLYLEEVEVNLKKTRN
jgi:hypothetical protein